MKNSIKIISVFVIISGLLAFTETSNGLKQQWEASLENQDGRHDPVTSIHLTSSGMITVLNPLGVEVFDIKGKKTSESNNSTKKSGRNSLFRGVTSGRGGSSGITIVGGSSRNEPQNPLERIVYLQLDHTNAILEFNYESDKQTITLIGTEDCETIWSNNSLHWSPELYREFTELLAGQISSGNVDFSQKMGVGATAGIFFPNKYIENIVTVIPKKNTLLVNTLMDGLASINITNGEINWISSATAGGLSYVLVDEDSNSILALGGNPFWFPEVLNVVQTNKKLVRINLETGEPIWESQYIRNFTAKNNGGFEFYEKPDIRIVNNKILLNFNEIEIFDFETGQNIFVSDGAKDGLSSMGGALKGPAIFFGLPVLDETTIYRTYISKILAFGASFGGGEPNNHEIIVEATDINTGKKLWETEPFSRAGINNMDLWNDYLLLGFNGRDGIKALDRKTGKLIWSYELGRRGVTSKWLLSDDYLIIAEQNSIHILDPTNGNELNKIDVRRVTGNVLNFHLENNILTVVGRKDGIALYNIDNGSIISSVKTGFYPIVERYSDRIIVSSYDPTESFLILNNQTLSEIGSLSKSRHRTALNWTEEGDKVFEISRGKLIKYSL